MKLKTLLFLTSLLTSTSLFASTPLVDSVGIENHEGKKVILHKLDPKETYYSLGRRYNVKPADIQKFNNNKALKIGDVVKVLTDRSFVETTAPAVVQQPKPAVTQPVVQQAPAQQQTQPVQQQPAQTGQQTVQQYKVSAGETLYAIAKRFNTTVEDITKLNNLTTTSLTPGQIIQVKTNSADTPAPAPAPVAVADNTAVKRDTPFVDSAERKINNASRFGLFEKSEKGVATWIEDTSLDPSKKLVLHRFAPIGTVIKVTNPMTNRTSFAKVVGRINDNEQSKDVILIMTKNVAESIGAKDKRVHVNISYGSPNE